MSLFHSWRLVIWVFLIYSVPVLASFYIQRRNSEGKAVAFYVHVSTAKTNPRTCLTGSTEVQR